MSTIAFNISIFTALWSIISHHQLNIPQLLVTLKYNLFIYVPDHLHAKLKCFIAVIAAVLVAFIMGTLVCTQISNVICVVLPKCHRNSSFLCVFSSFPLQSWQCWHLCTTSNGSKLVLVSSWINFDANMYNCIHLDFKI